MNTKFLKSLAGAVCCIGLLAAAPAYAASPTVLNFYGITNNNSASTADGVANLRMEVSDISDIGGNSVRFKFTNNSNYSSLTDVYFADGALFGISGVTYSSGVSFTGGSAAPPDLPGGNSVSPAFQTTAGFLADADSPPTKNGVQNSDATGEWLVIDFSLKSGKTFADVLAALALPGSIPTDATPWLRVGLHVQSFTGGFSESFINSPIPEPETYAMLLAGLGLVGFAARRRKQGKTA
ncbi:MAG: PEPxxWA-CTERM sorting domain-containing protein [Rugosibacter sp.]|nr:PEPxxWA-CTERM sorting domain-containing protein [Rugosibacter sp.]